jgi:AcrR family transcriptional regulator
MAKPVNGRDALVGAARELLPVRAPSSVTGRELAERAGVNYGLIHHYFGTKEAVFRDALLELRQEFLSTHPAHDLPELLIEPENPYVRAVGRSQLDYSDDPPWDLDFPIGDAMVDAVRERVRELHPTWTDEDLDVEARARALAMLCLQLGFGLYQEMALDTVGVALSQRTSVEQVLQGLYRELAARA